MEMHVFKRSLTDYFLNSHAPINDITLTVWNKMSQLPVSKIEWAAWNGTLANTSVPGNIIHVRSLESWFPQVVQISFTNGLDSEPPISFIIDSKGDGTLDFVVRARLLKAVNASLFPFLTLSFSTNWHLIPKNSSHFTFLLLKVIEQFHFNDRRIVTLKLQFTPRHKICILRAVNTSNLVNQVSNFLIF